MPRVYKQECAHCGEYYEGYGKLYCSTVCSDESHRRKPRDEAPEDMPDTSGTPVVDEATGVVYVAGRPNATTPEQLFKESGLDPAKYEMAGAGTMKTWTTTMKLREGDSDTVYHVRNHGTRISFQERVDETFRFRPLVLNLNTKVKKARTLKGTNSLVVASDMHFPFHDERVQSIILKVCDIVRPKHYRDLGDALDCEALGSYDRDPFVDIGLDDECRMGGEWFATVTDVNRKWCDDFGFIEGNHEDRKRRAVWKEAERRQIGALLKLPQIREQLEWKNLLGLESLGWKTWKYGEHEVFKGKLVLTHGDSTGQHPEKAELARYTKSGASGHTHSIGRWYSRTYDGQQMWAGIGMTGLIRADYVKFPNWQQGFGVYSFDAEYQRWDYEQLFIHEGVTFFRGMQIVGDPSAMAKHEDS